MRKRIKYLDGLKGVATIIVTLSHFFSAFLPYMTLASNKTFYYNSPLSFITGANFAVHVFFVISGYLATLNF